MSPSPAGVLSDPRRNGYGAVRAEGKRLGGPRVPGEVGARGRPSRLWAVVADTDEEAERLASGSRIATAVLRAGA